MDCVPAMSHLAVFISTLMTNYISLIFKLLHGFSYSINAVCVQCRKTSEGKVPIGRETNHLCEKPNCLEGERLISQVVILHCGVALPRDHFTIILLLIFRHESHPSEWTVPSENRDTSQRHKIDASNADDGSSRIGIQGKYHRSRYHSGYTAFLSSMPQTPMSILSGTFCLPPFL